MLSPADKEWRWGETIANLLQAHLMEKAIKVYDSAQSLLSKIGLWAIPKLLPFPLLHIIDRLEKDDVAGANQILTNHCDNLFLENLSKDWWGVEAFNIRRALIQETLQAHQLNLFHLSIHTLLPHVEGIITDWLYSLEKSIEVPWREVSKAKKFRDIVLGDEVTMFTYRRLVESSSAFIIDSVMDDFKKWNDALDSSLPNRHATAHGKYEPAIYTKENSIKLFLLLDTIAQIMIANDAAFSKTIHTTT
jgi:hypothetical protein